MIRHKGRCMTVVPPWFTRMIYPYLIGSVTGAAVAYWANSEAVCCTSSAMQSRTYRLLSEIAYGKPSSSTFWSIWINLNIYFMICQEWVLSWLRQQAFTFYGTSLNRNMNYYFRCYFIVYQRGTPLGTRREGRKKTAAKSDIPPLSFSQSVILSGLSFPSTTYHPPFADFCFFMKTA